nr:CAP domain-containing protein [Ardenticatenales bacterium]
MQRTSPLSAWVGPRSLIITTLLFMLLFFAFPFMTSRAEEPAPAPSSTAPDAAAPDAAAQPSDKPAASALSTEQLLLQRVNEARAANNLPPLRLNAQLSQAAVAHVADMQQNQNRSHRGRDGSTYGQRIARAGYGAADTNEAIGWGYTMDRMVAWWLRSPVHRPILLSPHLQEVGIAHAGNGREWG